MSPDAFSLEWLAPNAGGFRARCPLDGGWLLFSEVGEGAALGLRRDLSDEGDVDLTDDAVLALIRVGRDLVGSCSGTTSLPREGLGSCSRRRRAVAVDDQGDAILPVRSGDPADYFVLPGPDYAATHANLFRVAEVKVHPQYDGTVENPYDVAVIRYVGTTSTTPVIPILAPEDDLLVVGSEVSLVDFGTTESTRNVNVAW